jgi:hypothetical protein
VQSLVDERPHPLHVLVTWSPPVATISGLSGQGLDALWDAVLDHRRKLTATGVQRGAVFGRRRHGAPHSLLAVGLVDGDHVGEFEDRDCPARASMPCGTRCSTTAASSPPRARSPPSAGLGAAGEALVQSLVDERPHPLHVLVPALGGDLARMVAAGERSPAAGADLIAELIGL